MIRKYSDDACDLIESEWADFVFIDGNHTYPFVLKDLENYWPKVKPGGYLTGHDYWHRSAENGGDFSEPMVFEAVTQFAKKNNLAVESFGQHGEFPACFAIKKKLTNAI